LPEEDEAQEELGQRKRGVCLGKLRYNYVVGCYIHCVPVSRGIHIIVLA
jgi:hypothetical protein